MGLELKGACGAWAWELVDPLHLAVPEDPRAWRKSRAIVARLLADESRLEFIATTTNLPLRMVEMEDIEGDVCVALKAQSNRCAHRK
jgi:hypothetical protein